MKCQERGITFGTFVNVPCDLGGSTETEYEPDIFNGHRAAFRNSSCEVSYVLESRHSQQGTVGHDVAQNLHLQCLHRRIRRLLFSHLCMSTAFLRFKMLTCIKLETNKFM